MVLLWVFFFILESKISILFYCYFFKSMLIDCDEAPPQACRVSIK